MARTSELERLKARVKIAGPNDPIYKSGLRFTMFGTNQPINQIPFNAFPPVILTPR